MEKKGEYILIQRYKNCELREEMIIYPENNIHFDENKIFIALDMMERFIGTKITNPGLILKKTQFHEKKASKQLM